MFSLELKTRLRNLIGKARGPVEVDWGLILIVLSLAVFGVVTIYGVTLEDPRRHQLADKQMVWVLLGIVACVVTTLLDYRSLVRNSYWIFAGAFLLLLMTRFIGAGAGGAQRWLAIPGVPFRLQPSEFAKLAVILLLAKLFSDRKKPVQRLVDLWLPALFIGPICLAILKQPDLGTTLSILPIAAGMAFAAGLSPISFLFGVPMALAGLRPIVADLRPDAPLAGTDPTWPAVAAFGVAVVLGWKKRLPRLDLILMAGLCIAAFVLAPVAWGKLRPYQRGRVISFLDPQGDPRGAGYQVNQAQIALGSGGPVGKGWAAGTQSSLRFLPEYQTDFVYSALGEQWGFVGTTGLLALYMLLFFRGLHIAQDARWPEGVFLATGIVLYFATHVFINIGICIGFLPVTGLPLSFMSYGGSATLTNFVAIGLLLSIRLRRFVDRKLA